MRRRRNWWYTLLLLLTIVMSMSQTTCAFSSKSFFQYHQTNRRTAVTTTISSSSIDVTAITDDEPLLLHSFWGKERSEQEIIDHITTQLALADLDIIPIVTVLKSEPPIVVIDNLLSPEHCNSIIQSAKEHLQRSTLGAEQEQSNTRTSTTAWIKDHQCEIPLRRIASAVARISGLPPTHMENLQVCRYQVGQEFAIHTDHLDSFNDLPIRGRLCTCLLYLQDCQDGGATRFPEHPTIDVLPRTSRAVFFWNTQERPGSPNYKSDMFLNVDRRLRHAGMPVEKGEKWICNRWVHPIDIHSGVRGV